MSIVTKSGDKGDTSLIGGERVEKDDPRIEAYGTIDELNAILGMVLSYSKNSVVNNVLTHVQNHLFTIGAELAALDGKVAANIPHIQSKHTVLIEKVVYDVEKELPKQTGFILPKGTVSASFLHFARTVCRRAERNIVKCRQFKLNPETVKYLNRLSDLLFILARLENKGEAEEVYVTYE